MRSLLVFLPLVMLVMACGDTTSRSGTADGETDVPEEMIPFRVDGTLDLVRGTDVLLTLDIEIAESDSATVRGMMQRTSFPPNSGMLFLFEEEELRGFWMGNTPLSLDLLFISADSQIVSFTKYAPPFSTETIPSKAPSQFVLEVPAGFVDSNGIVEGDRLRWRRTDGS